MALSYSDMMFECVFDNTKSNDKKTKKKTEKKLTFFDYDVNENINFDSIKKIYSKYEFINKDYSLIIDIINETNDLPEKEKRNKKHYYGTMIFLYGAYFSIIYTLYRIIINGDYGYNYFIEYIDDKYKFIKNDKNTPVFFKNTTDQIINFYENSIKTDENKKKYIKIENYNLLQLTNDNHLTQQSVRLIDILNRYFKHLSTTFEVNNFGLYIVNEDKSSFDYQSFKSTHNVMDLEIKNLIYTINRYRNIEFINNYEIKYQISNELEKTNNISKINNLKKLNYIINYGYQFTLNPNTFINYINEKLIFGGNIILFLNDDTPIISKIIRVLSQHFNKIILTKTTLEIAHNWVFIAKGFKGTQIINKITPNNNLDNFLFNSFNMYCKKLNLFMDNIFNVVNKFNNKDLIREINKKYIEIYKWCINNNVSAINIFSDSDKEPKIVNEEKIVNYLFPHQKGINKADIKIFNVSIYSVTPPIEAKKISNTIKDIFNGFFKYTSNLSITDGTANVGGNTINFSDNFNKVNTVEINKNVFNALKHNCQNVYKKRNISFYNGDCTNIIPKLKQDIIFIDPPWDGMFYKAYDKLHLYLGNMDIIDIVKDWYEKKLAKLYVIKCPANLDFDPFISTYSQIFIEKLKNYNVIYIVSNI
jgi:hypothetical protein